jgi:integral membrane sensor domain MASE1
MGYLLCYSIAIAAIYALNGLVVIDASKHFDGLAAIWSANALLLCAIHRQKRQVAIAGYLAAFAASLFVNWYAGNSALVTLFFSIANIVEVALALYLLKKFIGTDADHFDAGNLHRFVGIMVFVTAVSASLSVTVLPDAQFKAWQSWFLSDLLGMLFVVPSLMILRQSFRPRQSSSLNRYGLGEFSLIGGLSAVVAGGVFMQNTMPVLFLISIPLLIAVFRCGRTGAVLSMLIVAGIAVISTLNGTGPIAGSNAAPFEQLLLLQLFLASQLLISLPVASVLEDRERSAAESVTREQQLRLLAQQSIVDHGAP